MRVSVLVRTTYNLSIQFLHLWEQCYFDPIGTTIRCGIVRLRQKIEYFLKGLIVVRIDCNVCDMVDDTESFL